MTEFQSSFCKCNLLKSVKKFFKKVVQFHIPINNI